MRTDIPAVPQSNAGGRGDGGGLQEWFHSPCPWRVDIIVHETVDGSL